MWSLSRYAQLICNPKRTALPSFLIAPRSAQRCSENRAQFRYKLRLCRLFTLCFLTQASKGPSVVAGGVRGRRTLLLSSWWNEKASPPPALPAMLYTLKSYTTTSWIAAQCIPLHFVTLPWRILCQKWLALTVLWWIKELLQLWNRAEFLIHVKSAFCSEGTFLMLPVIPLLCFFLTSVVTFVKIKGKFKLISF